MTAPDPIDRAEVARTLRTLFRSGDVLEVRAPSASNVRCSGRPEGYDATFYGYFDNSETLLNVVSAAFGSADWPALYVGMNPVGRELLSLAENRIKKQTKKGGNTADTDVGRRRYFLVDVDPKRRAGISATDDEKAAAQVLAHRIRVHLAGLGWPDPIVADSGNGWHLLYRVDLPGADGGLLERCLKALAALFDDDETQVDTTVGNAARITKLYGTLARKGDHTAERPHRMSRILEIPDVLTPVPEELLRDLAAQAPADQQKKPASPGIIARDSSSGFDLSAWIEKHIPRAGPAEPWQGGRRWIVDPCVFSEEHRGTSAAIVQNASGTIAYKCQHNGCNGRTWHDVRELFEPVAYRVATFRPKGEPAPPEPEPWHDPIPFDAPILLPDFPLEALPPALRDFADELAKTVQVPVDLPASLALAAAAVPVARRYVVAVGRTHEEPTNLYVVGALEPGTRKTETFGKIVAPLEELEEELARDASPRIKKAQARREADEARMKELKSQIAKAKHKADAQRQELEELAANLTEVPHVPQVLVGDETAEHLTSTLAAQGGRVGLFDADAGLFEIVAGRYSSAPNFEVYLKAHAGDTIRVGRTTRDRDFVKRPALTVGICVQPDVIRSLASTPGFRGRGLLGRFLYTIPEDLVGTRRYTNRPISEEAARTYSDAIKAMFRLPSAGEDRPHRLLLAGAALTEWAAFADRIESEQREGERLAGIRDWASKAAGAAARLAGIFHVLRYRDCRPAAPWELEVDVETVVAATAVVDYYTEHALYAYGLMEVDERVGLAKRLLRWIERFASDSKVFKPRGPKDEIGFTLRDCHRHHRAVGRPEDLLPGLDLLESRGYLRRLPPPEPRPAHRPPSTVFLVSPLVPLVPEVPEAPLEAVERRVGA
ncbi:MAG: YfjI family protein [Thermoanaerobaculia bacterium]